MLHTEEGQNGLTYLYNRGIDLEFIKTFRLGFASKDQNLFQQAMHEQKVSKETLASSGLIKIYSNNYFKDFFSDRIMIPIQDNLGAVIGFTARKFKEETQGPKYINTAETPLFKKSKILFGFNYSRKNIAKEKKAIIVEGQIDALRLIFSGFAITVAGQGTAFGEEHVKELVNLGITGVYLAFDPDKAGQEATVKVGQLFQKEAVDVSILELPQGMDPDKLIIEKGPKAFEKLLQESQDYISFLVKKYSNEIDISKPAGKNEITLMIVKLIRQWEHPLMVHEGLKKVAKLLQLPEAVIGVGEMETPNIHIQKSMSVSTNASIDPNKILETDLLRWLLLIGESLPKLVETAALNLNEEHFTSSICRHIFSKYIKAFAENKPRDLLSLTIELDSAEQQFFLAEVLQKKVNKEKAEECLLKTIQEMLDRHWMRQREEIKQKIHSGKLSEEEVLELAKKFDEIRKQRPQAVLV
ncbi:MAG: toprim domain-containing protein [Chlamydiae bacterium]|nr:toprim domain-containing protein [Chlamydiota bacterium]